MSTDLRNYPLCWPDNVARTPPHKRGRPRFEIRSVAESVQFLLAEVARLNSFYGHHRDDRTIVSTNVKPRLDGLPASNESEPSDTGAAVYFFLRFERGGKWHERPIVLTCDKWSKVSWNIYAMAKDIEAQRARDRWGCGTIEQAFRGYLAIPERTGGKSWWDTLGIPSSATRDVLTAAYKTLAKTHHPDVGGSRDGWNKIQEAYEQGLGSISKL